MSDITHLVGAAFCVSGVFWMIWSDEDGADMVITETSLIKPTEMETYSYLTCELYTSTLFYAVFCWGSSIGAGNNKRLHKPIRI